VHFKIFAILLFVFGSCADRGPYDWIESLPAPWTLSNYQLDSYLPQFHKKYPDYYDRLIALNLWRVGTPYGLFCLGEEQGIDLDPIIRIDSSDCTVHVLTTIALAESQTWQGARDAMIDIHYKPDINGIKKPTYKSRWHFTSDRLLNNPRTVDITSIIASPEDVDTINIILNKKIDGSQFLELGWTSKLSTYFIPIQNIGEHLLSQLPVICGIAFVKKNYFKNGIVIAHEGYVINRRNLIHASSVENKTVNVNLLSYIGNVSKPRFDGVMFYEIRKI